MQSRLTIKKCIIVLSTLVALSGLVWFWALGHGAIPIARKELIAALLTWTGVYDGGVDESLYYVITDLRMKRVCLAFLIGMALSVSGAVFQAPSQESLGRSAYPGRVRRRRARCGLCFSAGAAACGEYVYQCAAFFIRRVIKCDYACVSPGETEGDSLSVLTDPCWGYIKLVLYFDCYFYRIDHERRPAREYLFLAPGKFIAVR